MTTAKAFCWLAGAFAAMALVSSAITVVPDAQLKLAGLMFAAAVAAVVCGGLAVLSRRSAILQRRWVTKSVVCAAAFVPLFVLAALIG
jgi:hypothetical protein